MNGIALSRAPSRARRVIVLLAFLCISSALVATPSPGASSFSETASGEYVVYRDRSWKDATWIGFLQYDEATFGATVYSPNRSIRVSILFRTETLDGKLVLVGQRFLSEAGKDDAIYVNYLMRLLPDLYRYRADAVLRAKPVDSAVSERSSLLPPRASMMRDEPSFGGNVVLTFAPEVPVFNLASLSGTDGLVLSLERIGRISQGDDDAFYHFVPASDPITGAPYKAPAISASDVKEVDGLTLGLDGQWTMIADNTFFLGGTAMLVVDTIDLDFLGLGRSDVPLTLMRLFTRSSSGAWVDPSSTKVVGDAKVFRIESLVFEPESKRVNRDIKVCVPSSDGARVVFASLTVSEDAYRANRAYFESVLPRRP